ncbi:MAG TPA: DUF6691 family protein [Polyangia bacterium]
MKSAVAFVCGLLFAVGLAVAGMTQPSKVLGFLDIFGGKWDPSLAFVMVGAIGVFAVARALQPRRPLFERAYPELRRHGIDRRLVAGSILFGIGWGLIGFCPGPAVVALGAFLPGSLVFGASLLIGMAAFQVSDL